MDDKNCCTPVPLFQPSPKNKILMNIFLEFQRDQKVSALLKPSDCIVFCEVHIIYFILNFPFKVVHRIEHHTSICIVCSVKYW